MNVQVRLAKEGRVAVGAVVQAWLFYPAGSVLLLTGLHGQQGKLIFLGPANGASVLFADTYMSPRGT